MPLEGICVNYLSPIVLYFNELLYSKNAGWIKPLSNDKTQGLKDLDDINQLFNKKKTRSYVFN